MLRSLTLLFVLVLPAVQQAQDLSYAYQFATLANGMAADETGTYLAVDATRQEFPGAAVFNRAITLRKFTNATGVEEWSRDVYKSATTSTTFGPQVALDAGGVYVCLAVLGQRAVVRKFGRDGTPMWIRELSDSTFESVTDIATANGVVYAVTLKDNTQPVLYALNAETGQVNYGVPMSLGGDFPRRVVADASGVYVAYGFGTGNLAKFSHAGHPQWEREFLPTTIMVDALAVHATGIYVGGYSFVGQRGHLARFDSDGTQNLTISVEPDTPGLNFAEIRSVTADSSGFYLAGRFSGMLGGEPTALPNSTSSFARKYAFDGQVVWTKVLDQGTGSIFLFAGIDVVQGGLQISGRSQGTFPGNPEDSGARAILARVELPVTPLESISGLLDQLQGASAGGLRSRLSGICTQLRNFERDVRRMRGVELQALEADLLLARIGDALDVIGCSQ